jgi:hypothetical protein
LAKYEIDGIGFFHLDRFNFHLISPVMDLCILSPW